jgi:hypothetical protein
LKMHVLEYFEKEYDWKFKPHDFSDN